MQKTIQKERIENPEEATTSNIIHKNKYFWAKQFSKDKEILDLACGVGYGSLFLATKGKAKKVIGADNSDKALKIAKQNYSNKKTEFINIDAHKKLPFKNNQFDLIVSFETIEHLKKPVLFISEIKRILRNGGLFLISTPNKKFTTPIGKKPANFFHQKEWHPKELKKLLKKYFNEVELYKQEKLNQPYKKMLHAFIQGKIIAPFWDKTDPERKGKIYKLVKTKFFDGLFSNPKIDTKKLIYITKNAQIKKGDPTKNYMFILIKCKK